MATLTPAKFADMAEARQANVSAPAIAEARFINFVLDLSKDVTMGTATDEIVLGKLPKGTQVLSAAIEQLEVGTGTGTLVARVGTTAVTDTLAANAAQGTVVGPVAAAMPLAAVNDTTMVNLLGAVAARTTGKIRVSVLVMEAFKIGVPHLAPRDKLA